MAKILGFSAWFHDSSACLTVDGKPIAFAEEERFSRLKHSGEYPRLAIDYCLREAGLKIDELDAIVYFGDPVQLIKSSVSTVLRFFPKSLNLFRQDAAGRPVANRYLNLMRIKSLICKEHQAKGLFKLVTLPHFQTHQGGAFLCSPFKEAAIVNMDFATEGATQTIAYGKGNEIETLLTHRWPNAWGGVYLTFTHFLGFRPLHDEYKIMGMAAYGQPKFVEFFEKKLYRLDDETGDFKLNLKYFSFQHYGLNKPWSDTVIAHLGPARKKGEPLTQHHYDLAASLQLATERYGVRMARVAKKLTGSANLCMAGGVIQNCLMNQKIMESGAFDRVFLQPLAGDAGCSLGAALYYDNVVLKNPRNFELDHLYLGPNYSQEIEAALTKHGLKFKRVPAPAAAIAQAISDGDIVGFFNGRMEAGPRALGARSILADPRRHDMKDILNLRVKHRESFRPFAPSVLEEHIGDIFESIPSSMGFPYMITTANVRKEMRERLPAVTHNDFTARPQAVSKKTNPLYWDVINEFYKLSGIPLVINTSFNDNEPIVCTPDDAIKCFMKTRIDLLALENYLVYRNENQALQ